MKGEFTQIPHMASVIFAGTVKPVSSPSETAV